MTKRMNWTELKSIKLENLAYFSNFEENIGFIFFLLKSSLEFEDILSIANKLIFHIYNF